MAQFKNSLFLRFKAYIVYENFLQTHLQSNKVPV